MLICGARGDGCTVQYSTVGRDNALNKCEVIEGKLRSERSVYKMERWSALKVFWSLGVFLLAALFEIGGGWLIWRGMRDKVSPRALYAVSGTAIVAMYGWVPLLQPASPAAQFGRIYAVYGAVFIVCSYGWAALLDGLRLDVGDYLGVALAATGALTALFWRR